MCPYGGEFVEVHCRPGPLLIHHELELLLVGVRQGYLVTIATDRSVPEETK